MCNFLFSNFPDKLVSVKRFVKLLFRPRGDLLVPCCLVNKVLFEHGYACFCSGHGCFLYRSRVEWLQPKPHSLQSCSLPLSEMLQIPDL